MQVEVNGETLDLPEQCTVAELLAQRQLTGRRLAVEIDGLLVPRSQFATRYLQPGERVEIVHAVGGG